MKPELQSKNYDDEIDLKELFLTLWQGRFIIVSCMLLCLVISVIYVVSVQPWWTAKAIVTKPYISQVAAFSQAVKGYQGAFEQYNFTEKTDIIKDVTLESLIDRDAMFSLFIQTFNSTENKNQFLNSNLEFKAIQKKLKQNNIEDEHTKREILNKWYERIISNKDNKIDSYTLSVKSISENESYELLKNYIHFINEIAKRQLIDNLKSTLSIKRTELEQKLQFRIMLAKRNLKQQIIRAENGLKIAEAAKINQPLENWEVDNNFPIAMGVDGIKEKINILKAIDNLQVTDDKIGIIINQLSLINTPISKMEDVQLFTYIEQPEIPLSKDSPQIVLIILISLIFGFIFGVVIIIVKKSIEPMKLQ